MTTIDVREVLVERRGAALWLRLNRPGTLNGLNQAILDGLTAGLGEAESDPHVRTVVITAEGRAFCAGADLHYARSLDDAPPPDGAYSAGQLFLRRVAPLLNRIESFPKPVIAAVNGLAVGGGLELLLCCDFAVAAASARIGDGHAVYGQIPGGGASVRLTRRLGLARAKQLMYTGELYPAAHFQGTDLLVDVVPDDELEAAVQRIADVIAKRSPVGVARMKALANDGLEVPLSVGVRMELEASALHEKSEDWREGITAFAEKRTPDFQGR